MASRTKGVSGLRAIHRERTPGLAATAIKACYCYVFRLLTRVDSLLASIVRQTLPCTASAGAPTPFFVARVRLTEVALEAAIAYVPYPTREAAWIDTRSEPAALRRLKQRVPGGVWVLVEASDVRKAMQTIECRATHVEGAPFQQ